MPAEDAGFFAGFGGVVEEDMGSLVAFAAVLEEGTGFRGLLSSRFRSSVVRPWRIAYWVSRATL